MRLNGGDFLVERRDLIPHLFHRRHRRTGILPFRLGNADLFADLVAFRFQAIARRCQLPALLVEHCNLGDPRFVAATARREPLLHQFRVVTN